MPPVAAPPDPWSTSDRAEQERAIIAGGYLLNITDDDDGRLRFHFLPQSGVMGEWNDQSLSDFLARHAEGHDASAEILAHRQVIELRQACLAERKNREAEPERRTAAAADRERIRHRADLLRQLDRQS